MPRIAREHLPGSTVHLISSFALGARVMDLPGARDVYLSLAERTLRRSDWVPLAYALMGSHVHWALIAGRLPPRTFYHPLHTGFALWVNQQRREALVGPERRFVGPVFADRPKTFVVEPEALSRLLAYLHNNPVRAGLVQYPGDSDWTSHRQYCDPARRRPWLAVGWALEHVGLEDSAGGRQSFHEMTCERSSADASWFPSDEELRLVRREARAHTNAPVEIATPRMTPGRESEESDWSCGLVATPDRPLRLRWEGPVTRLIEEVSLLSGVSMSRLTGRDRMRDAASARRLAVYAWTRLLERPLIEVSGALGISAAAAVALMQRSPEKVAALSRSAATVVERCWVGDGASFSGGMGHEGGVSFTVPRRRTSVAGG